MSLCWNSVGMSLVGSKGYSKKQAGLHTTHTQASYQLLIASRSSRRRKSVMGPQVRSQDTADIYTMPFGMAFILLAFLVTILLRCFALTIVLFQPSKQNASPITDPAPSIRHPWIIATFDCASCLVTEAQQSSRYKLFILSAETGIKRSGANGISPIIE